VVLESLAKGGRGGGSEKVFESVSALRIVSRDEGWSHGGGRMFARRWRLRRRASQRGSGVRWGGWSDGVGP